MSHRFTRALCVLLLAGLATNASAQCETVKLTASDGGAMDRFGYGVRIEGDRLLIPAKHDGPLQPDSGSAYIFDYDGVQWVESAKLIAAQGAANDLMGWESELQGDLVMLGTAFGDSTVMDSGTVVLFEFDGLAWNEGQTLSASIPNAGDYFGRALALDGDRVLIGAPRTDGAGSNSGSAYLFERIAGVWTEVQVLQASDGMAGDAFGWALDLDGERAVIGAYGSDTGGNESGAAYVFERIAGSYQQVAKLTPSDAPSGRFGWTVRIEGDLIVAGAPEDDAQGAKAGAAYLYERQMGSWVETQKLIPEDAGTNDRFGLALELDGPRMLIASPTAETVSNNTGKVYLYQQQAGSWLRSAKLVASDAQTGDRFGRYLDLDGDRALIGASNEDQVAVDAGAAYVFELDRGLTPYCFCSTGAPCNNGDGFAGCANSTGAGAFLSGCGSNSVASDDLVLHVRGLPANQFGLLFMGAGALQTPFGDGQRCVGPGGVGLFRYPVRNSGATGVIAEGPGLAAYSASQYPAAGHVTAGQTWNFQYWFRDNSGPCGGGFNVSNALGVLFDV